MFDYVALLEVKPLVGCATLDQESVAGAMVRAYVYAASEKEARIAISNDLNTMRLKLVDTEWLVRNDEVEWENPDDPSGAMAIARARKTRQVVYSEFHAWSHDAQDA